MAVDATKGMLGRILPQPGVGAPAAGGAMPGGFAKRLAELVEGADALGDRSNQLQADTIAGRPVDVHEVMIAAEEAGLAFQMVLEVRNKLLEAYQELMRMQV